MADKTKKPVLVALPDNLKDMSREEIEAWLDSVLPTVTDEVTGE